MSTISPARSWSWIRRQNVTPRSSWWAARKEIVAVPAAIRDTYKARLEAMVSNFRTVLGQNGIDYTLLDTSQPLEMALLAYLQTRRRAL